MNSTKKTARVAAALYLLMGVPAIFSYVYVPSILIVPGNAAATANNILASQMFFRLGLVGELISAISFLLLVMALYQLLNGVDKKLASLMVTFVLVSVPISFFNVVSELAGLTLLRGADFLAVFNERQLEALAMLFLRLHGQGLVVAEILWGLWLFPLELLVFRSGFIPRIIGLLLIVNCFAYPIHSLTWLLLPNYANVVNRFALIPEALGEGSIFLWLLIKGVKPQTLAAAAS